MIVVTDLKIKSDGIKVMSTGDFISNPVENEFIVNVCKDYRYMKLGYYVSIQAEMQGDKVYPASEDTIDVYRPPVLLIRAMKAGINVSPNILTGSVKDVLAEFDLPVVLFPIKPSQTFEFKVVKNKSALYTEMKKMTMDGCYVCCVQPLFGEIQNYKAIFGVPITQDGKLVENPKIAELTNKIYQEFKVPLFNFLIQQDKDEVYLCAMDPFGENEDEEVKLTQIESDLIYNGIKKLEKM